MKILESADLTDLPVVIKFIQNTSTDENIVNVMCISTYNFPLNP
jgi:hypothetical protein